MPKSFSLPCLEQHTDGGKTILKNPVRTAKKIQLFTITNTNRLTLLISGDKTFKTSVKQICHVRVRVGL
jgi:hypothetical protein